MTTTITKEQLKTLTADTSNGQAVSETQKYSGEFEGKFIGTLVGNATTAKELEKPYNFSLSGDASGTVEVNASSVILPVTVTHSTHADTSDFAGKTQLSARASVADMANTAEFAYRAGKFAKLFINLTGLITGTGSADNSNTLDIEVTDIDAKSMFVFGELAVKPDTSKIYVDVTGRHFWIYDDEKAEWVDCFLTLENELDEHKLRLTDLENINADNRLTSLEGRADALEESKADHEKRITQNESQLVNHELRLNNIETTTDLGQVSVRIQAIEDKNNEQDTALADEVTARTNADTELEKKISANSDLISANADAISANDAKDVEQDTHLGTIDTHLGTIDTHLGTIDTHLGTIDTKNDEQDIALANAKSELQKNISDLSSKVSALAIVPTGTIIPFAGSTIPTGYLLCNGSAVSRTSYAGLFEVISTLYGEGDGSTTFNLPDLRDRFLEGAGTNTVGKYLEARLPNITGNSVVAGYWATAAISSGVYASMGEWEAHVTFQTASKDNINSSKVIGFNAHDGNSLYGNVSTIQPLTCVAQYLIKY